MIEPIYKGTFCHIESHLYDKCVYYGLTICKAQSVHGWAVQIANIIQVHTFDQFLLQNQPCRSAIQCIGNSVSVTSHIMKSSPTLTSQPIGYPKVQWSTRQTIVCLILVAGPCHNTYHKAAYHSITSKGSKYGCWSLSDRSFSDAALTMWNDLSDSLVHNTCLTSQYHC